MLADVQGGRLEGVLAYSSSRFYRRVRELDELIDLFNERQIEVATVVSGRIDLTTADGRMTARLLAVIDQGEAERIGERSARAKADLKANGSWLGGGARAYAYERIKDEAGKVREHRIVTSEQAVLREAANRALAGESLNRIAVDLNRRGVPTSQGRRWQPSKLRALLTSPFHAGRYPDGTRGNWPAIFSDDEHLLLRSHFPRNTGVGRGRGERPGRAYVLAGLAHCSECGRKLLGSSGSYRCQVRNGGCGKVRIASWVLDRYVDETVLTRPEVREADPSRRPDEAKPAPATADEVLVRELRDVEARRLEARDGYADGSLSLEDFRGITDALARRAADIEARLHEQASAGRRAGFGFQALARLGTLDERWRRRELDPEEIADLHDFLAEWIDRVVVSPARRRGRPRRGQSDVSDRARIEWREGMLPGDGARG
jgi:site-specific DNA recombinase